MNAIDHYRRYSIGSANTSDEKILEMLDRMSFMAVAEFLQLTEEGLRKRLKLIDKNRYPRHLK